MTGARTAVPPIGATDVEGPSVGQRITGVVDRVVLSVLAVFALWTLAYYALPALLPASLVVVAWLVASPIVVWLVVRSSRPLLEAIPPTATWVPLLVGVAFAGAAALIVRPDLDDASYVVRSTWIAAHGDLRPRDVIFSGGVWPAPASQDPYLPSVEALFGWAARITGLSAGTVVYVLVPPAAAFLAAWALTMQLRAWRARRVSASLVVAAVFLIMGGATHASWGNLNLGRIWQGKVLLLSIVVPLLFALTAALWSLEERRGRAAALVLIGLGGVVGIGLSPAAVFVVPGVVVLAVVPGLVRGRWADAALALLVGAGPCLAAGLVVQLMGGVSGNAALAGSPLGDRPWLKVLGGGTPMVLALVAAAVAVLGYVAPRACGTCSSVGRVTALATVMAGVLISLPPLYRVAVSLMGTDAIAWRVTWVVPVPVLVGLLASLPRWSRVPVAVPVTVAAVGALIVGGLPLWSPANGAWIASPGAWKERPGDLEAARWAVAQQPSGLVLSPVAVSAAIGTVTADVRPVGSRTDYMEQYRDTAGARMDDRLLLQRLADGGTDPADAAGARTALDALGVQIACGPADGEVFRDALAGSFRPAFANSVTSCYVR